MKNISIWKQYIPVWTTTTEWLATHSWFQHFCKDQYRQGEFHEAASIQYDVSKAHALLYIYICPRSILLARCRPYTGRIGFCLIPARLIYSSALLQSRWPARGSPSSTHWLTAFSSLFSSSGNFGGKTSIRYIQRRGIHFLTDQHSNKAERSSSGSDDKNARLRAMLGEKKPDTSLICWRGRHGDIRLPYSPYHVKSRLSFNFRNGAGSCWPTTIVDYPGALAEISNSRWLIYKVAPWVLTKTWIFCLFPAIHNKAHGIFLIIAFVCTPYTAH